MDEGSVEQPHLKFLYSIPCGGGPPEYAAFNRQSRRRGGRQIGPCSGHLSLLTVLRLQAAGCQVRETCGLRARQACAAVGRARCGFRCRCRSGFCRRCAGFRHGSAGIQRCRRCRLTRLRVGNRMLSACMHTTHDLLRPAWQPGTTTLICRIAIRIP